MKIRIACLTLVLAVLVAAPAYSAELLGQVTVINKTKRWLAIDVLATCDDSLSPQTGMFSLFKGQSETVVFDVDKYMENKKWNWRITTKDRNDRGWKRVTIISQTNGQFHIHDKGQGIQFRLLRDRVFELEIYD